MVLPTELRTKGPKTLEERLADKFDYLQIAREEKSIDGSDVAFDEIAKSMEILLKGLPEAHEQLMLRKKELDDAFIEERDNIVADANNARDDIQRDFIYSRRLESAKWDYREIYEEMIMDIMQEYQLVDMKRPTSVSVVPSQTQPPIQTTSTPVEQKQPESQPQIQPEKKMTFFEKLREQKQQK